MNIEELAGKIGAKVTDEAYAAKEQLAEEFGRIHGWKRTERGFTTSQLARQSNGRRRGEYWYGDISTLDHAYFYRETGMHGRPAAIAVHLYDWPNVGPQVEELCREEGLHYVAVSDYPSWWYPGATQLVLYTPANPQPRKERKAWTKTPKTSGIPEADRCESHLLFSRYIPAIYRHKADLYWSGWTGISPDQAKQPEGDTWLVGELGRAMRRMVRNGVYGDLGVKIDRNMVIRIQDALHGYELPWIKKTDCSRVVIPFPKSIIDEQEQLVVRLLEFPRMEMLVINDVAKSIGVSVREIRDCVHHLMQRRAVDNRKWILLRADDQPD